MSSEYLIHINFNEIRGEIKKLQGPTKEVVNRIIAFVDSLEKTTSNIQPAMKRETHDDEHELWKEYQQLQREKLAVLDLSHEWGHIESSVTGISPKLGSLVKEAIQELTDHITILAETHRAHIDILEIYNTRKIEILALVITAVISYVAVWEFFVRDLLTSIALPYNLSPDLNYALVALTLLPVLVTVTWAWTNRRNYF